MTVRETCGCGAVFEVQDPKHLLPLETLSRELAEFRSYHAACSKAEAAAATATPKPDTPAPSAHEGRDDASETAS